MWGSPTRPRLSLSETPKARPPRKRFLPSSNRPKPTPHRARQAGHLSKVSLAMLEQKATTRDQGWAGYRMQERAQGSPDASVLPLQVTVGQQRDLSVNTWWHRSRRCLDPFSSPEPWYNRGTDAIAFEMVRALKWYQCKTRRSIFALVSLRSAGCRDNVQQHPRVPALRSQSRKLSGLSRRRFPPFSELAATLLSSGCASGCGEDRGFICACFGTASMLGRNGTGTRSDVSCCVSIPSIVRPRPYSIWRSSRNTPPTFRCQESHRKRGRGTRVGTKYKLSGAAGGRR